MIKLLSIFAVPALTIAATAAVAGEPVKSFTHEGVTYVYEATPAADGATLLTGHALSNGAKFRLLIKDGKVKGEANRRPVSFSVNESRGAASGAVLADRSVRVTPAE